MLPGYVAVTDTWGAAFPPELLDLYPDAVVICTVREPKAWWKSWIGIPINAVSACGRFESCAVASASFKILTGCTAEALETVSGHDLILNWSFPHLTIQQVSEALRFTSGST
jgi:hypothetical protein